MRTIGNDPNLHNLQSYILNAPGQAPKKDVLGLLPHANLQEEMNKKDQINQIKARLGKLYKSRCYVCHCKKSKSGMTFHHLWYLPGELTYSDFHDKLVYYQELENLVRQNPKRFLYVCSDHHQAIERNVRWCDTNFKRLIRAVRMTKKAKATHFITGII